VGLSEDISIPHEKVTDSERSIISKPLLHKMTILAFRNSRSYESEGKKKSWNKKGQGLNGRRSEEM